MNCRRTRSIRCCSLPTLSAACRCVLSGATAFPAAMAFGAAGDKESRAPVRPHLGEESRAIGVQWNWFPVADVNSNPANPIINTRSFGEDPALVGEMVAAYIERSAQRGIADDGQAFSRPRRYRYRFSSRPGARDRKRRSAEFSVELVPFRECDCSGCRLRDDGPYLGSGH
jgi:hypothetical protein